MTEETAQRINSAASRAWLFAHGLYQELSFEDIATIKSVSVAQIQTAADFINAADEAQLSTNGKRTIRCTVDPSAAEKLKAFISTLPSAPPP